MWELAQECVFVFVRVKAVPVIRGSSNSNSWALSKVAPRSQKVEPLVVEFLLETKAQQRRVHRRHRNLAECFCKA